jgi:hypothetical protein
MCNLCDPATAKAERDNLKYKAEQLEDLARHFRNLAAGRVKPHTAAASEATHTATSIVRYLVEEYV